MSIKLLKPSGEMKFYSTSADEAIDLEKSDLSAYSTTGDLKYLKMKEGQKPTVFVCRPLLAEEKAEIQGDHLKFHPALVDPKSTQKSVKDPKTGKKRAVTDADKKPTHEFIHTNKMFLKYFELACTHLEHNGQKVSPDMEQIPLPALIEIGSMIFLKTQMDDAQGNG